MSTVYFDPWVGPYYRNGGVFKYKILAVGDSHYCSKICPLKDKSLCGVAGDVSKSSMGNCSDFTNDVVLRYINGSIQGGWTRTYTKFSRALTGGSESHLDVKTVWNSIAFYNFVQSNHQFGPRESIKSIINYKDNLYDKSIDAFKSVVSQLQPDFIIVWGNTVWNTIKKNVYGIYFLNILESNISPADLKPIGKTTGRVKGKYSDTPIAMKITHPSSSKFKYSDTTYLFKNIIRLD